MWSNTGSHPNCGQLNCYCLGVPMSPEVLPLPRERGCGCSSCTSAVWPWHILFLRSRCLTVLVLVGLLCRQQVVSDRKEVVHVLVLPTCASLITQTVKATTEALIFHLCNPAPVHTWVSIHSSCTVRSSLNWKTCLTFCYYFFFSLVWYCISGAHLPFTQPPQANAEMANCT